jgi:divalent metal cation (Fe/Co/Zn/Cd) transporter
VNPDLSVTDGHVVAKEVRHQILHHVPHAASVTIHVDPVSETGGGFHRVAGHVHDGLPVSPHN